MSIERQPISTQEFSDRVNIHRLNLSGILDASLPNEINDLIEQARIQTRHSLSLNPEDVVVIFGEQTYGLNESPKVIGKRVFAEGLKRHDIVTMELFASYDVAGSESGIYRMQLPHPNTREGNVSINILPGWKKGKNVATSGFRSPTHDELRAGFGTIESLYGSIKSENISTYLENYYSNQNSYAEANIQILREFERQIGLEMEHWITEDILDTQIAKNGGMEVMLFLWPKIVERAKTHPTEGVRVPELKETPFHLYHAQDNCMGRMESRFYKTDGEIHMESVIGARCMHCGHTETTNPQEIVNSDRKITWRAIPRVVAYSTLGIADGHITGGGSIYNATAENTINGLGIPYFPVTNMNKTDENGTRTGIFRYQSAANTKGEFSNEQRLFVQQGRAAMADLVLSVGVHQLKDALEKTLDQTITSDTKIDCPEPLPKYSKVIGV